MLNKQRFDFEARTEKADRNLKHGNKFVIHAENEFSTDFWFRIQAIR